MKLSIVIPVYNVERYVAECIHSVLDQQGINTLDVEIVVVNEGAKDNSLEIVNQLLNGKKMLLFFHRRTGG